MVSESWESRTGVSDHDSAAKQSALVIAVSDEISYAPGYAGLH